MSTRSLIEVIPIWKTQLTRLEVPNVKQTFSVSMDCQTEFLAPKSLDVSYYRHTFPNIDIHRIDDHHLESIASYNRLMLNPDFYGMYRHFDFIAIVQTDAFVLKDLSTMPNFDFDYLGAPWVKGVRCRAVGKHLFVDQPSLNERRVIRKLAFKSFGRQVFVGNGGLSIRNVKSFARFVKDFETLNFGYLDQGINEDIIISTVGSQRGLTIADPGYASTIFREHISIEQAKSEDLFGVHAPKLVS